MVKYKRMLGSLEDPSIIKLMNMIPTQSKDTLALFGYHCIMKYFLPIYEQRHYEDHRLDKPLNLLKRCIDKEVKFKDIKTDLKLLDEMIKAQEHPVDIACLRAIRTAAFIYQTPTHSLDFVFYGLATMVYHHFDPKDYDAYYIDQQASRAARFFIRDLRALRVIDEKNPVNINWKC